ncbi:hypothetical protein DPMN_124130 [Dreissena polymorpha]|uniref:Uncharacterized protein n=1 Tax=Dreissena polymorpha TaxID=45954 RepID=A0A9D4GSX3_DREPO|nr:hypothetical protein DPMN_124130 [Dreissena polymorpha]
MEYFPISLGVLLFTALCYGQQGNFQPQPTNQNFQPMQPPNQNFQPMQPTNQNMQPMPATNQQPGQQVPGSDPQGAGVTLTPEQQSELMCAQVGRQAVSQCFQQNGGFDMMTVIALLSNGTQGQLPQNPNLVKQNLCQASGPIISCVFSGIARFNNSQQCSTIASYVRLEQETVGLLTGVQVMCGKGLMPKLTPCTQRLNFDLTQCITEVDLDLDLYSPRGARIEGAIIGDNQEIAKMFCDKRKDLYACQNRKLEQCEGANLLQELSGNDQRSIQSATDLLCQHVDEYVSGLVCFQRPSDEVNMCAATLITEMTSVTIKQIRDDLSIDDYFKEYCKVRISNLICDSKAWGDICKPVAVQLKTKYQCNLLPTRCKNEASIRDLYSRACAETNFPALQEASKGPDSDKKSGSSTVIARLAATSVSVILALMFI